MAKKKTQPTKSLDAATVIRPPASRIHVDEHTALAYSAVWGSVRIISDTIMSLPVDIIEPEGKERNVQEDGPENQLFLTANEEVSWPIFVQHMVAHCLTWGNGYAEIEYGQGGMPVALWTLEPDRVRPDRDKSGRLFYRVREPQGGEVALTPSEVLHCKGLGWNGLIGYSPIRMARESVSLGIAAERYGGSFFGNSGIPSIVVTHPKTLGKEGIENLTDSWSQATKGQDNWQRFAVLEEGMEVTKLTIPPEDAQFLMTRTFQVRDVGSRWYGIPPPFLGDLADATFSNVEQLFIVFVQQAIIPWVKRLEIEISHKLFWSRGINKQIKFNVNGLLRGDLKARSEFYKVLWNLGVLSQNDILQLEDMDPIGEVGDRRYVPLNVAPIDKISELIDSRINKNNNGNGSIGQERIEASTANTANTNTMEMVEGLLKTTITDVITRVVRREQNALHRHLQKDPTGKSAMQWAQTDTGSLSIYRVLIVSLNSIGKNTTELESLIADRSEYIQKVFEETEDKQALIQGWSNEQHSILYNKIMECIK